MAFASESAVTALIDGPGPGLHIPDGFVSVPVALAGYVLTAGAIALAVRATNRQLDERAVPLMGVTAAFIFAAQMMNFPVAGGTSGHLLGGALAAILLGPWAAIIVMSAVVGLQALLFQDGGLLAMGVNIFNMGVLTALVGYAAHGTLGSVSGRTRFGVALSGFVAAWLSVEAAAVATSVQLWLSGTSAPAVVFPAMIGVHAAIGIGEGLITAAALSFIRTTRPDLLRLGRPATN